MRSGRCLVIGAGDFSARGLRPRGGDLVIAADGGLDALRAAGILPALVVGDMDSLSGSSQGLRLLRFPRRKDDTDIALGIRLGLARGYGHFMLYGASGSRPDHFFANLQLISSLSRRGHRAMIVAPGFSVYALSGGRLVLPGCKKGARVSVFSVSAASTGVALEGLAFPMAGGTLRSAWPLGVSNQAVSRPVAVGVRRGSLLVFAEETVFQEPVYLRLQGPVKD